MRKLWLLIVCVIVMSGCGVAKTDANSAGGKTEAPKNEKESIIDYAIEELMCQELNEQNLTDINVRDDGLVVYYNSDQSYEEVTKVYCDRYKSEIDERIRDDRATAWIWKEGTLRAKVDRVLSKDGREFVSVEVGNGYNLSSKKGHLKKMLDRDVKLSFLPHEIMKDVKKFGELVTVQVRRNYYTKIIEVDLVMENKTVEESKAFLEAGGWEKTEEDVYIKTYGTQNMSAKAMKLIDTTALQFKEEQQ